jgi:hypothetical protein
MPKPTRALQSHSENLKDLVRHAKVLLDSGGFSG